MCKASIYCYHHIRQDILNKNNKICDIVCQFFFFCLLVYQGDKFLRATAVPAGTAEARISYGDSVRLSVRLSRPGAETTE